MYVPGLPTFEVLSRFRTPLLLSDSGKIKERTPSPALKPMVVKPELGHWMFS